MDGEQIVTTVRRYLGTKWVHQGRRPGVAIDCVGILICCAWDNGYRIPDYRDYARNIDSKRLEKLLDLYCDRVPVDAATNGNILGFYASFVDKFHHVGIKSPIGIIHASCELDGTGCVREEPLHPTLLARLTKVWRLSDSKVQQQLASR